MYEMFKRGKMYPHLKMTYRTLIINNTTTFNLKLMACGRPGHRGTRVLFLVVEEVKAGRDHVQIRHHNMVVLTVLEQAVKTKAVISKVA